MATDEATRVKLTKTVVDSITCSGDRPEWVPCADPPVGFGVKVYPTGRKVFYHRYRVRGSGKQRWYKIGVHGSVGVEQARRIATSIAGQVAAGGDPHAERKAQAKATERAGATFATLCDEYLAHLQREVDRGDASPRTLQERTRILGVAPRAGSEVEAPLPELVPLRSVVAADVTDEQVARALDPFEERGALVMGNRVQRAIGAAYTWAKKRVKHGITHNPVREMETRHDESSRERTLVPHEIARVWPLFESKADGTCVALRLILLTGQRPGEVRRMRWEHIDGDTWRMPAGYRKRTRADRGKQSSPHAVPLSRLALAELDSLDRKARGIVFARQGNPSQPIARQTLSRAVARLVKQTGMDRWTPHDLRRTARTLWTDKLNVDPIVAEKIVGHALPPVLRVYDRGEQWDDRVDALGRWAQWIIATVEDDGVAA